jgi:predicted MFS family arabinose efflux permease
MSVRGEDMPILKQRPTPSSAPGDAPYASYVVTLLAAVYALNIADRYVMSVLIEPIRAELHLTDSAIGFLTGVSLAFFYVIAGLPMAALADRTNRVRLIAASLAAWSLFTALCGVTRTYWQLLLARVLVGVGEAGGTPPSGSLISDFFGWRRRAFALSLYSLGAAVGSMIGAGAGYVAETWGWRTTFFLLGIPGLLLAAVLLLTVREPVRGRLDGAATAPAPDRARLTDLFTYIAASPSIRHCLAGSFLYCLWAWGLLWWTPSFLVRSMHMTLTEAGRTLALIHGIGGTAVLLGTSAIMRVLQNRSPRSVPNFIALACLCGTPPALVVYTTDSPMIATIALWVFVPITYAVFGPPYSLMQNLFPPHMRAQGLAMLMIASNVGNLIVAPQLIGVASDALAARYGADSLRMALVPLTLVGLWAAFHWWRSGRGIEDAVVRAGNALAVS